jgi:hypothetical protein
MLASWLRVREYTHLAGCEVQSVPQNVGQLAEGQLLWHQEFHFVQVWQVPLAPVYTIINVFNFLESLN